MYTLQWMKFNERWRRLAWRLNTPTYSTFVGSTIITLAVMRTVVSHVGPADTRKFNMPASITLARVGVKLPLASVVFLRLPQLRLAHHGYRAADQARVAADGTYMRRKYAEVYDNPLYRCACKSQRQFCW